MCMTHVGVVVIWILICSACEFSNAVCNVIVIDLLCCWKPWSITAILCLRCFDTPPHIIAKTLWYLKHHVCSNTSLFLYWNWASQHTLLLVCTHAFYIVGATWPFRSLNTDSPDTTLKATRPSSLTQTITSACSFSASTHYACNRRASGSSRCHPP
jgi:hypothetical protein